MTPNVETKGAEPKRPWVWFHWQNLNDSSDKTQGSGWRHGRCWWHFRSKGKHPDPDVCFSWNLWTHFCGLGMDIDDEDLTFSVAFPPVAFWLSFSSTFWLISKLAPRKVLAPQYPDTIVIDERETGIAVHGGRVWINPWCKRNDWVKADPWWVRGVSFSINPFEWKHISHEVRCYGGSWDHFVGSWEHNQTPDRRETFIYPYTYVLKSGDVQERTATVFVDRMTWRPRCLQWTRWFDKVRTSIDVTFSDEVGERTGSWKGGTIACGYELKPGETPEQSLRRMEKERKF